MSRIRLMIAILLLQPLAALADTTKVWLQEPLTLHIPIGQEIRVIFPTGVDLQVPLGITTRLQSLAPNPTMVYWTALEPIESSRVIASSQDGKSVYILDFSASESGLPDNVVIEDPARKLDWHQTQSAESDAETPMLTDPPEILLTRFAAQSLYAPSRLIPSSPDILPQTAPALPEDFALMRSSKGESYRVEVVAQWLGYDRYITAILLSNLSPFTVPVRMENLRGNFPYATPQHLSLGPAGSLEDRTTLYLISQVPFQDAILEDAYDF